MNYKELVKLDEQIERLDDAISVCGSGGLSSKINFESTTWGYYTSYSSSAVVCVLAEVCIKSLKEKKRELIKQKEQILNKKWYQFWI